MAPQGQGEAHLSSDPRTHRVANGQYITVFCSPRLRRDVRLRVKTVRFRRAVLDDEAGGFLHTDPRAGGFKTASGLRTL